MIHFHRYQPIRVTHVELVSSQRLNVRRPVTRVIERCVYCPKIRNGDQVEGKWTLDELFGQDHPWREKP